MRGLARLKRLLLLCLPVASLALGLAACGGARRQSNVASGASAGAAAASTASVADSVRGDPRESLAAPVKGDGDGDSPEQTAFDSDDFHSMHFGHAAGPADERAIAALVKRYYGALAAEDAPTVCSLLLEVVAEAMPEGDRGGTGDQQAPTAGHATCATAISGVLAESHRALLTESRTLRVIGVRVRRRRASALLRFGGTAVRHILLYKESGAWKIGTLADEDLG